MTLSETKHRVWLEVFVVLPPNNRAVLTRSPEHRLPRSENHSCQ